MNTIKKSFFGFGVLAASTYLLAGHLNSHTARITQIQTQQRNVAAAVKPTDPAKVKEMQALLKAHNPNAVIATSAGGLIEEALKKHLEAQGGDRSAEVVVDTHVEVNQRGGRSAIGYADPKALMAQVQADVRAQAQRIKEKTNGRGGTIIEIGGGTTSGIGDAIKAMTPDFIREIKSNYNVTIISTGLVADTALAYIGDIETKLDVLALIPRDGAWDLIVDDMSETVRVLTEAKKIAARMGINSDSISINHNAYEGGVIAIEELTMLMSEVNRMAMENKTTGNKQVQIVINTTLDAGTSTGQIAAHKGVEGGSDLLMVLAQLAGNNETFARNLESLQIKVVLDANKGAEILKTSTLAKFASRFNVQNKDLIAGSEKYAQDVADANGDAEKIAGLKKALGADSDKVARAKKALGAAKDLDKAGSNADTQLEVKHAEEIFRQAAIENRNGVRIVEFSNRLVNYTKVLLAMDVYYTDLLSKESSSKGSTRYSSLETSQAQNRGILHLVQTQGIQIVDGKVTRSIESKAMDAAKRAGGKR